MTNVMQKVGKYLTKQQLQTAVFNPQGSKEFLKKMVPMSVSLILYNRVQLEEKDFLTRTYNGVQYKLFKPKLQNVTLQNVRDWVNSALEAFDKNYLRELYLILGSRDDPDVIFESYKFQFKYMGDDVIHLHVSSTEKELQQSTDSMLEAMDSLKLHTKYKEAELDIKMAVTYYEDVTPLDYNPPFYNKNPESAKAILESLEKQSPDYLLLGLLKTGHHTLKCRGKGEVFALNRSVSSSNLIEDMPKEPENSDEAAVNGLPDEVQLPNSQEIVSQSVLGMGLPDSQETELETQETDRRYTQTPTVSELSAKEIFEVVDDEEPECFCRIYASFEHIGQVKCSQCWKIRHCVCVGYLSQDDIPDPYACTSCTDVKGYKPQREHKMQSMSTYRLAVAVAYFTEAFPHDVLSKISTEMKDWVVTKMKEYKVLKKQDNQYIINMELLRNSYIKGIFCNSFPQKRKTISNNPTLEEPKERGGIEQKKRRLIE